LLTDAREPPPKTNQRRPCQKLQAEIFIYTYVQYSKKCLAEERVGAERQRERGGQLEEVQPLRHISRESQEQRLSGELEGPDAYLFDAALARCVVVQDVAGEGVVHLVERS
jgi:hypothetical protein